MSEPAPSFLAVADPIHHLAGFGVNHFAATPAAGYGIVLLAAAFAYFALQTMIIRDQGTDSTLAAAVSGDWKGKASPVLYAIGIGLSFVDRWLAIAVYSGMALLWLIPDRRLERTITQQPAEPTIRTVGGRRGP